jgi:prephenate dehydrogenase
MLNEKSIVVLGAGNGWGQRIFAEQGKFTNNIQMIEIDTPAKEAEALIRNSQIIFLAIPDDLISDKIDELMKIGLHGKILLDCATNKHGFSGKLKELDKLGISVCSTHPMIGSKSPLRGQNVLIMPIGDNSIDAKNIAIEIFSAMEMKIKEFQFDNHSNAMVILQMVPHLTQRILIDALGEALLSQESMNVATLSEIGTGNYFLTELGIGRVAIQDPKVSAGIIETALKQEFGISVIGRMLSMLSEILIAGTSQEKSRKELKDIFQKSVDTLDPTNEWREKMAADTKATLIRLVNRKNHGFVLESPNKQGILAHILKVVALDHQIDMTAIDSEVLPNHKASFTIGTDGKYETLDELASDLSKLGVDIIEFF